MYNTKARSIMLILTSTIMKIHSHLKCLLKKLKFSLFGDTITTTNIPNLFKLPSSGKEYICFQTEGKTVWAAQCAKSRSLTKVMETIFEIDSFEQQYIIINVLIQYV